MRNDASIALHSLKTSSGREISTHKQKYEGVVDNLARATAEIEGYRNQAAVRDRETARAVKESQELGRRLRGQVNIIN